MDVETNNCLPLSERINKEAPQLVAVLREMTDGLDNLRSKIQALTAKVLAGTFPTADGISYLEAKHLQLLKYCQSQVYYLLRKARGLPLQGHPVVHSLVEIRLYLEKIRPIDKKHQYQINKLTKVTETPEEKSVTTVKGEDTTEKTDDLLKYRPNPDMLQNGTSEDRDGVYRPPKLVPTSIGEDKMSRQERNALRKEKESLRQAKQPGFITELMNELEGRPEEITETVGPETMEFTKFRTKMEDRRRQEEDNFTRAPVTKSDKKTMKHLMKSRNELSALTENFFDEIKALPLGDGLPEESTPLDVGSSGDRKFKKRKRKH